MASYRWQEIGDPLRLFHDPEAEYGPNHEAWQDLIRRSSALGKLQSGTPDSALSAGWAMAEKEAGDEENTRVLRGARDYANRVLSGEFLDPSKNQALAMELQRGLEGMGAYDSQAEASGRYGSGAWGQMKGRSLADLRGNLYGQGLQQMTNMAGMAPSIYGSQYLPAEMLQNIGSQREGRQWGILSNESSMLGKGTQMDAPYYNQNPVMGGVGTWLSMVGAIKGMGGGSGGNSGKDNGMAGNRNYGGYQPNSNIENNSSGYARW